MNINLIDWRKKRTMVANNRFYVVVATAILVSAMLTASGSILIMYYEAKIKQHINLLDRELGTISSDIRKINDIQKQIENLVNKRKAVEQLQKSRTFLVRAWSDIANAMPDGIVLDEMDMSGTTIELMGSSIDNEQIARLMQQVQLLNWVSGAKLSEIKTSRVENQDGVATRSKIDFRIEVSIKPNEIVVRDDKNTGN